MPAESAAQSEPASTHSAGHAASPEERVYPISAVKTQPKLVHQVQPEYPDALRDAGVTGYAVIDFIVATDGTVQRAFALKSSNNQLAAAALKAVRQWRFSPGIIGGKPVNTHLQVPIGFSLEDSQPPAPSTGKTSVPPGPVYTVAEVNRPPVPKRRIMPQYPAALRRRSITGEAMVDFVVTPEGKVADAHAISATEREFGSAAVAAVEGWLFVPARLNGVAVNCRMQVPIVFTLNND